MIYINGVKEGSTSGITSIGFTQSPVVGRQASADIRYLDGLIDDLRVSNIARSDSAILEAYNLKAPTGADTNTTYKLNFDQSLNPVYQPTNWTKSGGRINQVEYDPNAPNGGSNVLHINPGNDSNASQFTDYIPLTGVDEKFILSGDIKVQGSGNDGVRLQVNWYDPYHNLIKQNRAFALKQTQDWKRHSMILEPPKDAAYAQVLAVAYNGFDGYFDNIQFEKSSQVREYNAIDNSSFEQTPLKWSYSDSSVSVTTEEKFSGTKSLKIQRSSTSGLSYAESETVIPVKKGQVYTISGLLKTDFDSVAASGGAWIHVNFYDTSGKLISDFAKKLYTKDANWVKDVNSLQPSQDGFYKVRLEMKNASGKVYFDNIRLSNGKELTEYEYDQKDNYVTKNINQLGKEISYENDSYGQITKVTTPTGKTNGTSNEYTYDGQHRLKTVKDIAGNVATYTYDANGNVTGVEIKENGTTPIYVNNFEYDEYGNMVKETAKPDLGNPGEDKTTEYIYDESGRLIKKINPGDMEANPSISLEYDFFGLKNLKILDGYKYTFGYNKEGQIINEGIYNSQDVKSKEFLYAYDKIGRLESLTEKDENNNQIAKFDAPSNNSVKQEMYNKTDQLNGFDLKYKSNSPITYWFTYLSNGLVNTVKAAGKEFKFFFAEGGQLSSKENPNKTIDEFVYNTAGQVMENKTNGVTKSTVNNHTTTGVETKWSSKYEYYDDSRIERITGQGAGSPSAHYTYSNGTEKLNRLTQAVIDDGTKQYTFNYVYDSMGNIQEIDVFNDGSVQKQTFSYNNDNQITNFGFEYDDNGNLTKAVIKEVPYEYSYDKANRLTQVKDGFGNVVSYTYDSQGQRLTKTVGNDTITYHYFNGDVLFETKSGDLDNILHALYIRSPQGKPLAVSMNYDLSNPDSNTWYYYHYNAHGDIVAVTDKDGNVFREYVYDPYGNIISVKGGSGELITDLKSDTFNHAYTYAGYRFDKETGLYYLNARYYEAGIGRFLTKDSLVMGNQYSYANGDPINFVDPSGYFIETVIDVLSVGWSAVEFWNNPSWTNAGYLLWDVAAAVTPFVPGSYTAKAAKLIAKADDVDRIVQSSKTVSKNVDKGLASRGYKPGSGERTFDGYVNNNVPINKETKLYTDSLGFNNVGSPGGQFKRFGTDSHAGLAPHVHQPIRNVYNGIVRGVVGNKTKNGGVTVPTRKDVKQFYDYLNNGKYRIK